ECRCWARKGHSKFSWRWRIRQQQSAMRLLRASLFEGGGVLFAVAMGFDHLQKGFAFRADSIQIFSGFDKQAHKGLKVFPAHATIGFFQQVVVSVDTSR